MGLSMAVADFLVVDTFGEQKVREGVAVEVSEFAASCAKFDPTEAMGIGGDAVPTLDGLPNLVCNAQRLRGCAVVHGCSTYSNPCGRCRSSRLGAMAGQMAHVGIQ